MGLPVSKALAFESPKVTRDQDLGPQRSELRIPHKAGLEPLKSYTFSERTSQKKTPFTNPGKDICLSQTGHEVGKQPPFKT